LVAQARFGGVTAIQAVRRKKKNQGTLKKKSRMKKKSSERPHDVTQERGKPAQGGWANMEIFASIFRKKKNGQDGETAKKKNRN